MGLNLDLCAMLGAPKKVGCPKCGKKTRTNFADYDIECGQPFKKGAIALDVYCEHCEHAFEYTAAVIHLKSTTRKKLSDKAILAISQVLTANKDVHDLLESKGVSGDDVLALCNQALAKPC